MGSHGGQLAVWIVVGLLGLSPARAANYYVAPTGSDTSPGTLGQPFLTIQRAASVMVAGDTAYIRAGVYRETVTPKNSGTQNTPVTYMAYNGESVTVSGADVIPASSWVLSSGNIYTAPLGWSLSSTYAGVSVGANQVFLDGQMMIEARWPNTTLDVSHPTVAHTSMGSYADGGAGLSTATITDVQLPSRPSGYWNDATINICLGACYEWSTGPVTDSSTPQKITFTFSTHGDGQVPTANNPYFLTGKLTELDEPGEWFRDGGTSSLFLWAPSSDSPSLHIVEAKRRPLAFDLSGRAFITVQGLSLFAATITSDAQSQYLVLDGLQGRYIGHDPIPWGLDWPSGVGLASGIVLRGSNNLLRNSTIAFCSGSGVYLQGTGQLVLNNVIHDTDYIPTNASPIAAGTGGYQQNQLIAYNTIYNSGREGIYHASTFGHGRILHNEIYEFGLQTNDLGCTDTYETDGMGTEIAYNLCHDGHGLLLSNSYPYVSGIYLDNGSSNFVVHHNSVWNVEFALSLNSPGTNHRVYNNTFVGTSSSFTAYPDADLPGSVIQNNIFVAPINATPVTGAVMSNNILPGIDPQFVDPTNHNYQLQPTSPAIGAGLIVPPYTNGFTGTAPDIGAYDHAKPPWKAGVQNAAVVSAPSYAPTLTPGAIAVVTGSIAFDSGVSVVLTDGAGVDWPAPLVYVVVSPPQLAFRVPSEATPGVAMITLTNGDDTVSLSSAPLLLGTSPINISASQGSGHVATISTSFATPLQATVRDGSGNPVPGVAVVFAVPANGAGGTFGASATVTTNSAGVAVAPPFTSNAVAGTYSVTASAAGAGELAVFNLTNRAGATSTVTATQGSGQAAAINTAFAAALKAAVQDVGGNGVPGITVTFTAPETGASGSFPGSALAASAITDNAGVATAPAFVANGTTGAFTVTATIAGITVPASFSLINTAASIAIISVNVAGGGADIAQNAWIEIRGKNLVPNNVPASGVIWSTAPEFASGRMPTQLDGFPVTVTVNNKPAFVYFFCSAATSSTCASDQINVLTPLDSTVGSVPVVVANGGVASAPFTVNLRPAAPSFPLYGGKYVVATHADYSLVGPTSLSAPGYAITPAQPGETIVLYAFGFGLTTTAFVNGSSSQSGSLVSPPACQIGGLSATVTFAGAISPGLYQLNVIVPAAAHNGDNFVTCSYNDQSTPTGDLVSVQR